MRRKQHNNNFDKESVIKDIKKYSVKDVARLNNISTSTVYNIKRNNNLSQQKYDKDNIIKYYEDGLSYKEISKLLGVSSSTIYRVLTKHYYSPGIYVP